MPTNTTDVEFKIGLSDSDKASMQAAITALVKASLITVYSSSATYALGDFVYYDGKFYKCTTAISTAEAWTSGHWEEATLNDVINKVNQAANSVENKLSKGDYDGTTGVGYSDVSDNLTPYSDESGTFQDNPVISQGTGTDNNTAIVTTGNFAQLREKQGNTVPVVQLLQNSDFTHYAFFPESGGSVSYDSTADKTTFSLTIGPEGYGYIRVPDNKQPSFISGHKYLMFVTLEAQNAVSVWLKPDSNADTASAGSYTGKKVYFGLQTAITTSGPGVSCSTLIGMSAPSGTAISGSVEKTKIFDITSWPADVIADLTAHPDHFSWYYNGSLAYNAGSLENADGVKLVCTKRQLWDEQVELGTIIDNTGALSPSSTSLRSKNKTIVIPNKPIYYKGPSAKFYFYDKNNNYLGHTGWITNTTFTPPANCSYVLFRLDVSYGTTYNHDITISLYYTTAEGGEGYDQHYEYKEPTVIDTGSEVLRSAGNAHDVKLPDGTILRNVGVVDLGTLEWTSYATNKFIATLSGAKAQLSGDVPFNGTSNKLTAIGTNATLDPEKKEMSLGSNLKLYVANSDWNSASDITGILYFELAEPTTEQGTPFPENIDIDDYGMMYWLDDDDNLVGIPQGAKFFYPVNYKGFTDDLYNRTEGDAGNVVIQSERAQLKEALGGTLRQLLAVSKSIAFSNTDFKDIGELNFARTYGDGAYQFVASFANIKSETANVVCTEFAYANYSVLVGANGNNTIYVSSTGISIRADEYTDADAFKAAMKGVLLAYEKA